MTAFDQCFPSLLKEEGGWVNDPRDAGGMTNLGVTRVAWEHWVGRPVHEAEMRSLTPALVAPFYRSQYWNAVHGDSFPVAISLCLFHCAVNSGPRRAAELLQGIVGAVPDGSIGPATIRAVAKAVASRVSGLATLVAAFQDAYRAYYRSLHDFDVFGRGWLNRADEVQRQAEAMIP
jgi:lysozyme family protein